jgi:CheY-like chemotaxis protein
MNSSAWAARAACSIALRSTNGDPHYDQFMTIDTAALNVPVEDAAFKLPAPPPPDFSIAGGRTSTTVPFELLNNLDAKATNVARIHRKVLLVDDEDALRRVMKDLLEREGYVVSEARDGVQALDQVDRTGPDVIVLDLNLPGLDGYGVLSHLRSRPATAHIPVVVLTAKSDEDNAVRVFQLGADDFLTKPFRARALSARLDAVLGRRASAIHVLDYCYIQAFASTNGTPGQGALSFTLDEHGVTPITIQRILM